MEHAYGEFMTAFMSLWQYAPAFLGYLSAGFLALIVLVTACTFTASLLAWVEALAERALCAARQYRIDRYRRNQASLRSSPSTYDNP